MSRSAVLCAVLVLLAGCSFASGGTPAASPQPSPDVEVSFVNAANATYGMSVLLLPRPADLARVTYADGSTETVGNLSTVDGVGLYGPTGESGGNVDDVVPIAVEPLDTRTYHDVGPWSSVFSTFERPPRNAALFVVVTATDGVYLWATGTCGGNDSLNAFGVEIRDVGPGVSVGCEGFESGTRETTPR